MASIDFIGGVPEVAKATGISSRTIRALCEQGRIEHAERVGRRWVINATREWPSLQLYRDAVTGLPTRARG